MSLSSPLIPANPNTLTNGTPADATQVMANFNNLVNNLNALLNSSTGAGYVGITSDTRWGGGASVQDALGLLKDQQQLTDTGSVNALVVTPAGSLITANVSGMLFLVVPANTTTNTTPTLKVGTSTALTIVNGDASAHVAGAIHAGRPALFWVDTVNSKAVHLNPLWVLGSATLTYTGMTATVTATMNYSVEPTSKMFNSWVASYTTGTSNATTFSVTGVPAAVVPATNIGFFVFPGTDNNASTFASASWGSTLGLSNGVPVNGAWTASGVKGLRQWSVSGSLG